MATKRTKSRRRSPRREPTPRREPPLTADELQAAWEWFHQTAFRLDQMTEEQVTAACRYIAREHKKKRPPLPVLTPPATPEEIAQARAGIEAGTEDPIVMSPVEYERLMHWAVSELRRHRAEQAPASAPRRPLSEHPFFARVRVLGQRALDIAESNPEKVIDAGNQIAEGINKAAQAHRADPAGTRRYFGERAISLIAKVIKG